MLEWLMGWMMLEDHDKKTNNNKYFSTHREKENREIDKLIRRR